MGRPQIHEDADILADHIIDRLGGKIVLGLPLGLGKAGRIANALYRRAAADRSISLDIFTALSLEPPSGSSDMERRFIEPFAERLYGRYERLAYIEALRRGDMPDNIRVSEFFLMAGRWLNMPVMQQHYVSANYTHAARMLLDKGVNVIAQLVAMREIDGDATYSISSNSDITLDILPALKARDESFMLVAEVNAELPYMGGSASLSACEFDHVLHTPGNEPGLFVVPKQSVSDADHAIGIHAASLVKDGGTIQIGIGSLGDALTAALIMRHQASELFEHTLRELCGGVIPDDRETGVFDKGLYAATEMFVDGFMELYRAGILKRKAADGALLHAGFFLGTEAFYRFLRELPDEERDLFQMRGISFVNELYGDEDAKRRDRVDARFVNSAMMATMLGETVSDTLANGKVVSGVGGQYNFVAQAFALEGAQSIITLNATRMSKGTRRSRIVESYEHATIPRHLRDIFVTEYGVADLRGRSDRDCAVAMVAIADEKFQEQLLNKAFEAGKIEKAYRLPQKASANTPRTISNALRAARQAGYCTPYPFGTDFTPVEQRLLTALSFLKEATASIGGKAAAIISALASRSSHEKHEAELERMQLLEATDIKRRLLCWALQKTGASGTQ
ncbi:acetyl-CoA hydrolase/transferase C-terminal domain-containing protein [Mesorhizobium sp. SB112]|uniref:acetyl-CoA hydrolase/transferase C-terminal domain-containing protein n=1 Tax=Mesorhizobium sp. SB112 TaxID=3151853 RepID=UPI0032654881